ncbi:MAG: flippase-like domain-containing protein [Candidatus Heimdallarchaeota archaeon]|nr:flippase-like domain-containing protein [Candidatus Heimdallarchaeota archaeon]
MRKSWLTYFIYVSLLFLLLALINKDLIYIPEIINPEYLIASLFFLFTGFICSSLPWQHVLIKSNNPVKLSDSLISIGLTIFSKYIPGKIWTIIGPAGYIAQKYNYSGSHLTSLSLDNQLIILWTGLILSSFGLFSLNGLEQWGLIILILWFILSITIFTNVFHDAISFAIKSVFKRNINISRLSFRKVIVITPYFILTWLLWCTGFYFLSQALTSVDLPFISGLGFAFAGTLGIMVIIAPGGIGVREGILVGYLMMGGLDAKEAASISIASRLWFLSGEGFIFFTALVLKKTYKK